MHRLSAPSFGDGADDPSVHNTKIPLTVWFWAAYLMTTYQQIRGGTDLFQGVQPRPQHIELC
jgi:hypothetical protein